MAKLLGTGEVQVGIKDKSKTGLKSVETNVTKTTSKLEKQFSALGTKIAAAFAGAVVLNAIKTLATNALSLAADLHTLANSIGTTTEQLSFLQAAAINGGDSADKMTQSMRQLAVRLGEAKQFGGEAAAVFENLGVDIETQGIEDIVKHIFELGAQAQTSAEKIDFIGKISKITGAKAASVGVNASAGAKGYNAELEKLKNQGQIVSDNVGKAADEFAAKINSIQRTISVSFAEGFFAGFTEKDAKEFQKNLGLIASGLGVVVAQIANIISTSNDGKGINTIFAGSGLILSGLAAHFDTIFKKAYKVIQFFTTGGKKPMKDLAESEKAVRRIIRSATTFRKVLNFVKPLQTALKFFGRLSTKVFKVLLPLEGIVHFLVAMTKTKDGMLSLMYALDKMVESLTFGLLGLGDGEEKVEAVAEANKKAAEETERGAKHVKELEAAYENLDEEQLTLQMITLYKAIENVSEQFAAAAEAGNLTESQQKRYIKSITEMGEEIQKVNDKLNALDGENEDVGESLNKVAGNLDLSTRAAKRLSDSLVELKNNADNVDTVVSVMRLPSKQEMDKLVAIGYINELKSSLQEQAEKQRIFDVIVSNKLIPRDKLKALADSMGVPFQQTAGDIIKEHGTTIVDGLKQATQGGFANMADGIFKSMKGVANLINSDVVQGIANSFSMAMSYFGANADAELERITGQLDALRSRGETERAELEALNLQDTDYYKQRQKEFEAEEKKKKEEAKKAGKRTQSAEVASAQMSAVMGSANAFASAMNLPTPLNFILAPINAALALATGMANVAKIKATKPPEFALGGLIPGNQYMDNTPIMAMGGEYVVNRAATEANLGALEFMNRGGKLGGNSVNINISGDIIGTNKGVEDNLLPALNNAYRRGVNFAG